MTNDNFPKLCAVTVLKKKMYIWPLSFVTAVFGRFKKQTGLDLSSARSILRGKQREQY